MSGAWTMAWKELREAVMAEGRPAVQMAVSGVMDVAAGISLPLFIAFAFDGLGPWPQLFAIIAGVLAFCALMGLVGPLTVIGDAYAGERERHTLETLLAGPLSDGAIVRGKMLAQYLLVGAHIAVVSVTAGVTAAIAFGLRGLLVLPAGLLLGPLAAAIPAAFIVGVGTLISLRASTVKKAQERISFVMIPIFLLPSLLPGLLGFTTQDGGSPVVVYLVTGIGIPAIMVLGAIVSNVLVFARFKRDRLLGTA